MSRLVWDYEGEDEDRHGAQCAAVGDKLHDDVMGACTAVRIDGGMIIVEFLEDEERVEKPRTKGHVYALVQRERAQLVRTGKRQDGQQGIMAMFAQPDAPVGEEPAKKRQRGGAFAERPKKNKTKADLPKAKATAARGKARVVEDTDEEDEEVEEKEAAEGGGALGGAALPGIALLGADYADASDEEKKDEGGAGTSGGKMGSIVKGFRKLSDEQKARPGGGLVRLKKPEYKAWLTTTDDSKGVHCKLCIVSLTKPKDKLSTTGYGWVGEGESRVLGQIPSEQKLKEHASHPLHKFNVANASRPYPHLWG